MLKKTIVLTLIFVAVASYAAAASPIRVFFNGSEVEMDVAPDLREGTTVVPARHICEAMGLSVVWEPESQSVFITGKNKIVILQIYNKTAMVNGSPYELLRSAGIISGRTMVPLRFISEVFGKDVQWNGTTKEIHITTPILVEDGIPIIHFTLPAGSF